MRSQDRHIEGDTVGKRALDSEPVRQALAGNTANATIVDAAGNELLASYAPLKALD